MNDNGKMKLDLYDKLNDIWRELEYSKERYYLCYKDPSDKTKMLKKMQDQISKMRNELSNDEELLKVAKEEAE